VVFGAACEVPRGKLGAHQGAAKKTIVREGFEETGSGKSS